MELKKRERAFQKQSAQAVSKPMASKELLWIYTSESVENRVQLIKRMMRGCLGKRYGTPIKSTQGQHMQ